MSPRARRAVFSAALFLASCAILGSLVNKHVNAQAATDESTLRDSLHQFTDVYSVIEQNYSDPLNSDKIDRAIYDGAIPSMLHVLDPHSNFYDPKAFAQMREDQHGRYYGIGMEVRPQLIARAQRTVVVSPFEGTPSFKAGIRPGDIIMAIDGKTTDGLDTTAVINSIKGPKGTHVQITMNREGSAKPLSFDLIRDEVARYSVDLAYLVRPGIGYIYVTNFMETTSKEVGDALDKFGDIKGLVIDLRGNPGGLLNEAVAMSDKFLQRGQVVVSQKGRAYPDQVYRASHGSDGRHYPIVVLVNRNTASAAEIVSGALQDHDRALIVGETTFGKGLVQTVFQVAENTGLALTTFHYYTPSGRLIQRNYNNVSLRDYFNLRAGAKKADKSNLEVKLTDSGRTVYGGGGITPDEKIDPLKFNHFEEELFRHYAFSDFARHYLANRTVDKNFQVDDAVMNDFKAFIKPLGVEYTDADMTNSLDWIKSSIKREVFTAQFGRNEGLRVRADWDPQIAKAVSFLPEAQTLEEHARVAQQKTTTASR